jgi:hypothetical protein
MKIKIVTLLLTLPVFLFGQLDSATYSNVYGLFLKSRVEQESLIDSLYLANNSKVDIEIIIDIDQPFAKEIIKLYASIAKKPN